MDTLPIELLYLIARVDLSVFLVMAKSVPTFARDVSGRVGAHDEMIRHFGYHPVMRHGMFVCTRDGLFDSPFGPARITLTSMKYYTRGVLHRVDGPAAIGICAACHGKKYVWYLDDFLHRVGGPASACDCRKMWYFCGNLHRAGGPAYMYKQLDSIHAVWYSHGVHLGAKIIDDFC